MPTTSPNVTIATANVHFGAMVREAGGLGPLEQYKPDVLLLQEVTNPPEELKKHLRATNYQLIYSTGEFGLAIALRLDSNLKLVAGSIRAHQLGKMGPIERTLAQRWARRPHAMIAHGMLAAKFKTANNAVLTVVDTRVTVSSNWRARKRQITAMSKELANPYYAGAVVVGGDMNHFPAPQATDKAMRESSALESANSAGEPTWRAKKSPMYTIAAFIRGQRVENMCAELDALLYRPNHLKLISVAVVDTMSDHRAIVASLMLKK